MWSKCIPAKNSCADLVTYSKYLANLAGGKCWSTVVGAVTVTSESWKQSLFSTGNGLADAGVSFRYLVGLADVGV